jgi:hypothetical protein
MFSIRDTASPTASLLQIRRGVDTRRVEAMAIVRIRGVVARDRHDADNALPNIFKVFCMTRSIFCCVSILALVAAAAPTRAAQQAKTSPPAVIASEGDCEARMRTLDGSGAEGEERLTEKNAVIGFCASEYKRDATIQRLVKECAKYAEQPVLKQQFVAECQLAAFNYANALHTLKAEYRK